MVAFLAALAAALVGAVATLVVGRWQREAGRREGQAAEAAEHRAQAAEHRAQAAEHRTAALAVLTAGLALAEYCDRPGPVRADAMQLLDRLRLAASPLAWPPTAPLSALAARAIEGQAVTVAAFAVSGVKAGPGARTLANVLRVFEAVAAAEAGDSSAGHLAPVVADLTECITDPATLGDILLSAARYAAEIAAETPPPAGQRLVVRASPAADGKTYARHAAYGPAAIPPDQWPGSEA